MVEGRPLPLVHKSKGLLGIAAVLAAFTEKPAFWMLDNFQVSSLIMFGP